MRKRFFRLPDGDRLREEVEEEVRFHLERKVDKLVAEGWSREAAEREAASRFGDVEEVKDAMEAARRRQERSARRGEWRDGWRQDLRYGVRQLLGNRAFTLVAVVTVALGIGVNTAIFSVVDGILFRPLPFPESHELVTVWTDVTERGGPADEWLSYANYADLREQTRALEALGAWSGWAPVWTDPSEPEQLLASRVSTDMFSRVLRVEPAVGRGFLPEDGLPGAPPVAILAHGFWERAFGADPSVVTSTLTLDDRPVEVIGVMPADFRPPFVPDAALWSPVQVDPAEVQDRRGGFSWRAVGRLVPEATVEAARDELADLGARLEAGYPGSNTGMSFTAERLRDDLVAEARTGLLVLLGAVAFVLLIACVNVANLLLARGSTRHTELAVRSALGAGRGRIVRQLLTESLLLAASGGAVGVLLAFAGTDLLVSLAPEGTPRIGEVAVDGRILAFTALITALAGIAFGLVPALRTASSDLHASLREGGRGGVGGRGRVRDLLVVGQVGLALVLLVGAGLLVRSFENLRSADLGFEPQDVLTAQLRLPSSRYSDGASRRDFYDRLEMGLAALPGVEAVGSTSTVPLTGFDGDVTFQVEGRPPAEPGQEDATWFRRVTPGYFRTMGIEIVRGRAFTPEDRPDARRVVIVNETLANRFFPTEDPIGKRVNLGDPGDPTWREIVGVAADIRNFGIREGSRNAMYSPYHQTTAGYVSPVLKLSLPAESVISGIRRVVADIDPELAVARVRTMEEILAEEVAPDRFVASLLSVFALVALALAAVGLYGVVSYGVSTRVRELGVRMALGAGRGRISRMVIARSLVLVGAGIAVGLTGAYLLTGLASNLLFGVSPTDPATFAAVALVLLGAASLAAAVPALRATRIDPTGALRAE